MPHRGLAADTCQRRLERSLPSGTSGALSRAPMSSDVVIVGAGFAGLTAAAAFAARGARVCVLESHATFDPRFRGELIHPRGVRALDALGLKAPLERAGAVRVEGFAVSPGPGSAPLQLPYPQAAGEGLGIDHHAMVGALREAVAALPGVELRTAQRVDALLVESGRVRGVRTAQGHEVRAPLTIGADGRASKVRSLLGFSPEQALLSYTVAVAVEGPVLPVPAHGHVFLGAPGPVLAYPYGDGRVRMCIDVPWGAAKGKDALRSFVTQAYAEAVPEPLRSAMLRSLIERPLEGCANHAISTLECVAAGAALIGEAGGCSHPLTATGMTGATFDALLLASSVAEHGLGDQAVLHYQRERVGFVRLRESFTAALYEIFRAQDEGSAALQAGIFRYWQQGDRGRLASMGILSCEDLRLSPFVTEYTRVMGATAAELLRSALREKRPWTLPSRIASVAATGLRRLEQVFAHAAQGYWRQGSLSLAYPAPGRTEPGRALDAAA